MPPVQLSYSGAEIDEAIEKVLNAVPGMLDTYIDFGTAPPISGAWTKPFFRFNSNPESGGILGWALITAGTPGVWHAAGIISDEVYVP